MRIRALILIPICLALVALGATGALAARPDRSAAGRHCGTKHPVKRACSRRHTVKHPKKTKKRMPSTAKQAFAIVRQCTATGHVRNGYTQAAYRRALQTVRRRKDLEAYTGCDAIIRRHIHKTVKKHHTKKHRKKTRTTRRLKRAARRRG